MIILCYIHHGRPASIKKSSTFVCLLSTLYRLIRLSILQAGFRLATGARAASAAKIVILVQRRSICKDECYTRFKRSDKLILEYILNKQ